MRCFTVGVLAALTAVSMAQVGHYRSYSVSADFHEVANRVQFNKAVPFLSEHKALLRKNLFVVSPSDQEQLYWVYGENDYRNLPSLVTVDNVLHPYHVFFDATLRQLEERMLYPKIDRMTQKLLAQSKLQLQNAVDNDAREAASKNVAYFEVAEALLNPAASVGAPARTELGRIGVASGFQVGAIFPYKVDYSRFIVRGHYTKSDRLKRYFKVMTWYGMMPFELADQDNRPNPLQIRMAMLAAAALHDSGAYSDWQGVYEPTSLYVGASNMFTPDEIRQVAVDVFGSATKPQTNRLPDFVRAMRNLRGPKIVARTKRPGSPGAELQFRFMGLRYIPDSEIIQRLTGEDRALPSGLDVMAVLGSSRAAQILDSSPKRYNPRSWSQYLPERARLRVEFSGLPASAWSSNLYWGWLDTLRLSCEPVPTGYPSFMKSSAWEDKNLSTTLASWTELRHDTILYGEQSVAEMGGDDQEPPFVPGFVEPAVKVYRRLIALSRQSRQELEKRGIIGKEIVDRFKDYEALLTFLLSVSEKELAGSKLARKEHERIRHIEGELEDLTISMLKYGANVRALTEDDQDMALVADVHTAGDFALEEGVGHADQIVAIVPIEGRLFFARGSVFSYYEFVVPISQRMTDEAWKASLRESKGPTRPHWTSSFFTKTATPNKD